VFSESADRAPDLAAPTFKNTAKMSVKPCQQRAAGQIMADTPQLPVPTASGSLIGDLAGMGQLATCIIQSIGAGTGVLYGARRIRKEGEATAKVVRATGIAQADVAAYAIRERARAYADAVSIVSTADLSALETAEAHPVVPG
jgi:hypothetical protein